MYLVSKPLSMVLFSINFFFPDKKVDRKSRPHAAYHFEYYTEYYNFISRSLSQLALMESFLSSVMAFSGCNFIL